MRHSPEDCDDEARQLDERFRDLITQISPHVRRPPAESLYHEVRRRRRRTLAVVTSVVIVASGVTIGRAATDDPEPAARHPAASFPSPATPVPSLPSAAPSQAAPSPAPLSDDLFLDPAELPVVPGIYEDWVVTDTRAASSDVLGPCSTLTISGLGAVETRERIYNHAGQGGAEVVLVRYGDEHTAQRAVTDLSRGLAGECADNEPNPGADGEKHIRNLDTSGLAWRTEGVVSGESQYVDYAIAWSGPVVAIASECVIGPVKVPPIEPVFLLVKSLRQRLPTDSVTPAPSEVPEAPTYSS